MALILLAITLKMNKGVRFLKKLWCSVSGVVKYKLRLFLSKVYRKDWRPWGIGKLVVSSTSPSLVRANQRIMACEMFTIRGLEYYHAVFPVTCQFPCSAVHCVLAGGTKSTRAQLDMQF